MNEFKGTKGKWEIEFDTASLQKNIKCGNKYIAEVSFGNVENNSNAKLIACAPDMLEMLENVVLWYGKRDFKTNELYSSNFQEPLIKEAMQLIKKATKL